MPIFFFAVAVVVFGFAGVPAVCNAPNITCGVTGPVAPHVYTNGNYVTCLKAVDAAGSRTYKASARFP